MTLWNDNVWPAARSTTRSPLRLASVYLLFLLIVCGYTFPLVLHLDRYLRGYNDPYLFTWMLAWVAKTLFSNPLQLFDTNIFYPYGNTLAFSEPLLVPAALVGAPVLAVSENPILAYNVTLLLFQALCGWSAYYATHRITGSEAAGLLAGIVFCVSPFRTGYYNFLNIHLSFAVPLAFLAFVCFLEKQKLRYLSMALLWLWLQAITIWYGGIPLALLLLLLALGFHALRPRGWGVRTLLMGAASAVVFVLAVLPVAWPYLQAARELGFERTLDDVNHFRGDMLSFFDAGKEHLFYRLADSTRYPGLFPGFTVYALSTIALFLSTRGRNTIPLHFDRLVLRLTAWFAFAVFIVMVYLLISPDTGASSTESLGRAATVRYLVFVLLAAGVSAMLFKGYLWRRDNVRDRVLGAADWPLLLGVLALLCMLLTLGPVMHYKSQPVGAGVYRYVYEFFPGFSAIRISLRLAFLALFLLGLLAGFGLVFLENKLRYRGRWRYLVYAAPLAALIEYLPAPLTYQEVSWNDPPPVYRWLASQRDDFAIMEFPTKHESIDSTYVFWSLYHGKPLVNGVSGFYPPFSADVAYSLAALPRTGKVEMLRSVHELRYLLIHLNWFRDPEERRSWIEFKNSPSTGLKTVGEFDDVIVFELEPRSERNWTWTRMLSTDRIEKRPRAALSLTVSDDDGKRDFIDVKFNGRLLQRIENTSGDAERRIDLTRPYYRVRPNELTLEHGYRITVDTVNDRRYRIGNTGTNSPVDIVVTSAGKPYGSTAAIWVNGSNLELPRHRGYSVVAMDPVKGAVIDRSGFDVGKEAVEHERLIAFFARIPQGSIVAVALNRVGGIHVSDGVFNEFRSIGATQDPRKRDTYASHVIVGVKGAKPGTAVEAIEDRVVRRVVGRDRRAAAMRISGFRLVSDAAVPVTD